MWQQKQHYHRAAAGSLVGFVMVVARNQLSDEDDPTTEPNCDAQDYECRQRVNAWARDRFGDVSVMLINTDYTAETDK